MASLRRATPFSGSAASIPALLVASLRRATTFSGSAASILALLVASLRRATPFSGSAASIYPLSKHHELKNNPIESIKSASYKPMSKLPKKKPSSPLTPPDNSSDINFSTNTRTINVETLRKLSGLLDNAFQVPGTSIGVGIDPLLGLIPGGGDFIGGLLSIYIVYSAARMGAPKEVLIRMASNIVFDSIAGTVPVVGDLFDVAWKANVKNIDILETHLASPTKSKRANRWFVYLMLAALVFLVIGISVVGVLIIGLVIKALYAALGG